MRYWNSLRLVSSVQRFILICACTLALCLFVSKIASAFEYPVPPDEVRAAYYLGQSSDHEKLDAFLKQYVHHFPYPAGNPVAYVESVEFRTPYEQIVLRAELHRETPLEADDAYAKNPGLVEVGVKIAYKLNYAGPIPSLAGFKFSVSQERTIEPKRAPIVSICYPDAGPSCANFQMDVVLQLDARQFGQKITTIRIENPEGQVFQTSFNLARLK